MREYFNLSIRKRMRTSEQGLERQGVKLRAYYLPFIYPTIWSGRVPVSLINTRIKLAKFVYQKAGNGYMILMKNKDEYGGKGFYKLASLNIIGINESKFDFEFEYLGISRYECWQESQD